MTAKEKKAAEVALATEAQSRYTSSLQENVNYTNTLRQLWMSNRVLLDQNFLYMAVVIILINLYLLGTPLIAVQALLVFVSLIGSAATIFITQVLMRHDTEMIALMISDRGWPAPEKTVKIAEHDDKSGSLQRIKETFFYISGVSTLYVIFISMI